MDFEVITKYVSVLLVLFTAIVIFRMLFKTYKKRKQTVVEKFAEEHDTEITLVNEIRTLIMNNETEYQNNMNQVLEKISTLENRLVGAPAAPATPTTEPAEQTPTTPAVQPVVARQPVVQPPTVPTEQSSTAQPVAQQPAAQQPVAQQPVVQPPAAQPTMAPTMSTEPTFDFDEDSDDESNTGDQVTETFVDGISCGSTANCAVF